MATYIIAIDQSTSATKAMLFSEHCEMVRRVNVAHKQYYPQTGWVEHDAEEIYNNMITAVSQLLEGEDTAANDYSIAITNQRETAVVWSKTSGKPVCNAVVWQCTRGEELCNRLKNEGYGDMVRDRTGLLIDPYFSASGVKWILDNVEGARSAAEQGDLLMGTIDSWLVWRLTNGQCHATDYTNASRTLLFNIHTLDWDDELLRLFTIPRSMMPKPMPSDAIYGETTIGGILPHPIAIAGILGDSHGALVGQMCFEPGMGKATYGTGSSVMVNIGEKAKPAPQGLVTSVGFAALDKVFYSFEGNIHCTGATINWLMNNLKMISSPAEIEEAALSVPDNGGVYIVPAFAGLGAPWWNNDVRAAISGMTLGTGRNHILRATLESIAYQIYDLVGTMAGQAGIAVKEMRVDGGPTRNNFLMQYQTDCLRVPVDCSNIEEASALGAVIMNRTALGAMTNFEEIQAMRSSRKRYQPQDNAALMEQYIKGWHNAVSQLLK